MIGCRVELVETSGGFLLPEDGDYGYHQRTKTWYARTPNGELANLGAHTVTEHDDGTITVSPSISVRDNTRELYHGFLERGVWRDC